MSRTTPEFFVEHYQEIKDIIEKDLNTDIHSVWIYEDNHNEFLYINDENKSFANVSYDFHEAFWGLCNKYHIACFIEWMPVSAAEGKNALPLPLYILDIACRRGNIEAEKAKQAVETAIADGANIDSLFKLDKMEKVSYLQIAAARNIANIVEVLLDKGSDINYQSADGYTALHLAALKGRKDAVKLLLERGANTTLTNKEGKTAEQLSKNEEIKALFAEVKPKEAANKASAYRPVLSQSEQPSSRSAALAHNLP